MKFAAAAFIISLISLASSVDAKGWSLLRGGTTTTTTTTPRDLQEDAAPPRGIRVRVFQDVNKIMWDDNQGMYATLIPEALQGWVVSVDGSDLGQTDPMSGLLIYEDTEGLLKAGVDVCVRPPTSRTANEAACQDAGMSCVQTKWSINLDGFSYRSEVEDNPNHNGVVWHDTADSALGTEQFWWKVYVKDFCYTLQEMDFVEREVIDEAWVRFSLVALSSEDVPSMSPSDSPSSTPTVSLAPSSTPSDSPSSVPTSSVAPSDAPSSTPTISVAPSSAPSDAPSSTPTVSVAPSSSPSELPSASPSTLPSLSPSSTPSLAPSTIPTF